MVTLFVRESSMGRALLVEHITPYSQALRFIGPDAGVDLSTEHGLAVIEHQIELQAAMLGYDAVFLLLAIVACAALPLLLVIGRQRKLERTDPEALVISE
jgi:DHA2 family multidrug resistance protein